jgi:hypothetical protein
MHQVLPKNNYLSKYTNISRLWMFIQTIPKHINLRSILPHMESKPAMMLKYTFTYFMFWCMYEKHVGKILFLWPDVCPKMHLWHSHTRLCRDPSLWESVRECEDEDSHSQVSSHFGSWSPGELPNLQRVITEVKTPRIQEFFMSLESYWKCKCLKWARMTHLDICNTSYSKNKS